MSYHSCSDSEPDTKAGAGAGQALVWRTVRVTIHCHSRGFSQVRPSANQIFGRLRFYVLLLHCSVYDSWCYNRALELLLDLRET